MNDPRDDGPVTDAAGDGVETTGVNAAQGRSGTQTFKVLVASLVLVVVVLFGLFFFALPRLSTNQGAGGQSGTNNPAVAAQFNTDTSAPKQAPPGAPSTTGGPQGTDTRTGNTAN